MAGLLSIASAVLGGSTFMSSKGREYVYLIPVKKDGSADYAEGRALQFWPSDMQDHYAPNWANKTIPGGSHPLYQWVSGGERTVSFTTQLYRETQDGQPGKDATEDRHNVDIVAAVKWLRTFLLPDYIRGQQWAESPSFLYLVVPKTALGPTGDYMLCFMNQCEITFKKWYPSGVPRMAEVSLGFTEVVQNGAATLWQGRSQFDNDIVFYGLKKGTQP